MSKDRYESPLASRYASDFMLHLFSPDMRIQTWRRLWVALARAEHELGLPVTAEQVAELEAHITDIDYETAAAREKEVRHDVMAHVYTYGKAAPSAAGIIHLGATSCYVTDNADLIIYREGLKYLRGELLAVLANLASFADRYKATPTLGYTHYQPAQLVTVGKRATLWMQDLLADLEELDFVTEHLMFLGCRGTTGTEASFMDLFDGDGGKIDEMNRRIAAEFGFERCFPVCGQTYPRKVDSRILNSLSAIAQSCYRMANDIRLLQHDRQVEEPFEKNQIGSSAMAYKRNPMRSERICSLSRYLMADAMNAPMTASVQWLERTLDDSANRRISLPEGFLCADAILRQTSLSMLAWDCAFTLAAQEADYRTMAQCRFQYLRLNPYRPEVYEEMTALLENACEQDPAGLGGYKTLAEQTTGHLEEVYARTSPLAYRIADRPDFSFRPALLIRLEEIEEREYHEVEQKTALGTPDGGDGSDHPAARRSGG